MVDLVNNIIALPINSRDRVDIGDSTTDFTIALKKSLRNVASLSVAGVVIPRNDTLIGPNNDTLSGSVIIDASISMFSVPITRTNYTSSTLATELQSKLNANTEMIALSLTFVVSYSSTTNRMTITATYAFGATHTWGISINFTSLRDIIGIGAAGTTAQTFMASAASTTLDIPCSRAPSLIRSLSYNITSSALTNSINTSYIASLGKQFNVNSSNNTLTLESQLVTSAHTTTISAPVDPHSTITQAVGYGVSLTTTGLVMAAGSLSQGVFIYNRATSTSPWIQAPDMPIRDPGYVYSGQGDGVSISGDGTTLAFGALHRIYIYVRSNSSWKQQQAIDFPDDSSLIVSLNIDGTTMGIGSRNRNVVLVYTRTGSLWGEQVSLTPPVGSVNFGAGGVSVSATGDNLVVADKGFASTVAYTYLRTAGVWALQQTITPGDAVGAHIFGVNISPAAGYIALSSPDDNSGVGATWIYNWTGSTWAEQQKIIVSSVSAALNTVGDTVAIGSPDAGAGVGSVYVYKRTVTTWAAQLSNYVGTGASGAGNQGTSIAITSAGDDIVWGGPFDAGNSGAVWTDHRVGTSWSQVGTKTIGLNGPLIPLLGGVIALSEDGTTLVAGFPQYNSNAGLACIYVSNGLEWVIQAEILPTDFIGGSPGFGTACGISADGNTVAISGPADSTTGAVWVYTRDSSNAWTKQAKITVATSTLHGQGTTLAMGESGNLLVIGGSNTDALLILTRLNSTWIVYSLNVGTGLMFGNAVSRIDIDLTEKFFIAGGSSGSGAVVFHLVNNIWTPSDNFINNHTPVIPVDPPPPGEPVTSIHSFGTRVSMVNSFTVVISDPGDASNMSYVNLGATFVYTRTSENDVFTQHATLIGSTDSTVADRQGSSLAMTNNGNTIIIGSSTFDDSSDVFSPFTGRVWLFDLIGSSWVERSRVFSIGKKFGADISAQKIGTKYVVGAPSLSVDNIIGAAFEFSASGAQYVVSNSIVIPDGAYSVFDIVNLLNTMGTDLIAANNGYSVSFDGVTKLTISSVIATPVTSNILRVSSASTFNIARWPSQEYKSSRVSNPMDFSINNDVLKSIVNHSDNSDNVLVDNTPDILYRRYPAGYTIEAGQLVDIQLRNNRDQIIDLNGADWIMTIYAQVRS
jgi:hypothetical protein